MVVNGRTEPRVDGAVTHLRDETGGEVVGVVADVADGRGRRGAGRARAPASTCWSTTWASSAPQPALEITDDDWRRYFEVNVLAATRLIRTYLPGMTARGWGRVLDIASDSAVVIPAEMIHYGMSKTALLAVSRGFAKEAAGTGVTVNSVIAGPTHTGGVEDFVLRAGRRRDLPWDEAQREFMIKHRPQSLLQRLIEPEEIAQHGGVPGVAAGLGDHGRGGARRRRLRGLDHPLKS